MPLQRSCFMLSFVAAMAKNLLDWILSRRNTYAYSINSISFSNLWKAIVFKELIYLNWLKMYFKESIWRWNVSVETQLPEATIQDFVFMHLQIWYNIVSLRVAVSLTSSSSSNPSNHCSKELHIFVVCLAPHLMLFVLLAKNTSKQCLGIYML